MMQFTLNRTVEGVRLNELISKIKVKE
jgi:hypothetical protein